MQTNNTTDTTRGVLAVQLTSEVYLEDDFEAFSSEFQAYFEDVFLEMLFFNYQVIYSKNKHGGQLADHVMLIR